MKMAKALEIMERGINPRGFMVSFEHVNGCTLVSDHFPDVHSGEKPIQTEDEAWQMAAQFAAKTKTRCVNVYVIRSEDFKPVQGYRARMIENR